MTDRRDTIALEVLKVLLPDRIPGAPLERHAAFCYHMADAMETARGTTDTARVDWLLAMLDSDEKTLAMARCIALGMTGREAIDAAAKRHPL
jgi:hypothetical protein